MIADIHILSFIYTGVWFSDMLHNRLRPTIQSGLYGLLPKGFLPLPHAASHTMKTTDDMKFENCKSFNIHHTVLTWWQPVFTFLGLWREHYKVRNSLMILERRGLCKHGLRFNQEIYSAGIRKFVRLLDKMQCKVRWLLYTEKQACLTNVCLFCQNLRVITFPFIFYGPFI